MFLSNLPEEVYAKIQDPFTLKARWPSQSAWKCSKQVNGHPIWSLVDSESAQGLEDKPCTFETKVSPGPTAIRDFMSMAHVQGLLKYERRLAQLGLMGHTEEAAYNVKRTAANNDPLCNFLMRQYLPCVQELVGKKLRESYSFLSHYLDGSALDKHTDVPRCPVNVSIHLGSSPPDIEWPLYIQTEPNMIHEYHLNPGDAVIYFGTKQPHWRYRMPAGTEYVDVLLFHYMIEE